MSSVAYRPVKANIFAAGAVLWRASPTAPGEAEVALIHRPRYDDWSFPKGKIESGETAIIAATREVGEETGIGCRLGRHISRVTYAVPGHRKLKRVDYWAAEAAAGKFVPNNEVDELRWVPADHAVDELSYPVDRQVLRSFLRYPADTKTVLIVRHAKAGRSERYRGDDRLRPLDTLGRKQAAALEPQLAAFGATHVHSADRTRCVRTVQPLADSLKVDIKLEPLLSEEDYAADRDGGRARARKIASKSGVRVICSQGKVIPDLVRWWAERDGISLPPARNRKASMWVLSLSNDKLVAADHVDSPLPIIGGVPN
ncbi:NUDIX hydrolase [Antrihabitans cavernicola]|uniref:NUDIX hydrolase n=1 Tax=Antrihabitans cavernicola TaxID=2495913 RepID=A0A5A7SDL0_9NOCA|nr:NUDIX hydrolase [Spelaeibacter cavernicola]KAA0024238.1 NUDIX hydrolase [Spelaeibacter cavernicola]